MHKYLLTAIIIALFCYGVSFGQCDHSIFVANQDDLPYAGTPYNPWCGTAFSYVFEFDILWQTNPFTEYAIIYPDVIESDLDLSVTSWRWAPGTGYQKKGTSFTGAGSDYLYIGILTGSAQDVFANMDWSVHYYNNEPD